MAYVASCAKSHISGMLFYQKMQQHAGTILGAPKVLLTPPAPRPGMSAYCWKSTGDEVILPAFTFVSTVNAFVLRGQSRFYRHPAKYFELDETRLAD